MNLSHLEPIDCPLPNLRIPELCGYVRIEERMRALEAGYQMFVPKPVEAAELTSIIVSLVQSPSGA